MNNKNNNISLDKSEKELLESVERGEWSDIKSQKKAMAQAQESARYTLTKSKSISIRLTPVDLDNIKAKAVEEGIPYQTLISSIIHKYTNGSLKSS